MQNPEQWRQKQSRFFICVLQPCRAANVCQALGILGAHSVGTTPVGTRARGMECREERDDEAGTRQSQKQPMDPWGSGVTEVG